MKRKSCKTLTIRNFQKKCERVLAKRQSAIANCELRTANSNPVLTQEQWLKVSQDNEYLEKQIL